jgi:outer membrane protein assembly factor BamD (BamD/ComL family)
MPVAENTERPAAQPPSEAQTPAGRLAAEAALLEEAQRALDARRPGAALDLIGRAERAFGESPLTQERNALEVESLWNLGRKAEARARAEQFLQRFPRSPHVVRIRSFSHVD